MILSDLKTKVTRVRILLDGAIVTRTGSMKLEPGLRDIWVHGITIDASKDGF